jgi:hypothetical protein
VLTPDPALVDTDVASVLYRARLFRRVVPAGLMDVVADRPLVISVDTLGEMLAFYADSFGLIELGRTVAVEYGRLRAATEALGRPVRATTCGSPHRRRPTGCSSSPSTGGTSSHSPCTVCGFCDRSRAADTPPFIDEEGQRNRWPSRRCVVLRCHNTKSAPLVEKEHERQ